MKPYYSHGGITIYHCRALDLLRSLPADSVDLIATDPPYFRVKDEAWDRQWKGEGAFLAWIGELCEEWRRVLKPNGSLYVFASTEMASQVEIVIKKYFRTLNNIRWRKPMFSTKAEMFAKDTMRAYFPASETIIFAEQLGAEDAYNAAWMEVKRSIFGDYLRVEIERAGLNNREVAEVTGCYGTVNHGGSVSNWLLGYNCPTENQYHKLRGALGNGYLAADYRRLRSEYEQARIDEETGRRFADLRRSFTATSSRPYTDVWDFPTVNTYPGKHPCEKPLAMMEHIVTASSRPGDVVADFFIGSGTTLEAAKRNGRQALGCDMDLHWCRWSAHRLSQEVLPFPDVA